MPEPTTIPMPGLDAVYSSDPNSDREFEPGLDALKSQFMVANPHSVDKFIEGHRAVVPILLQAVPYLRECFGPGTPLTLEVMWDEGAPRSIHALALWRAGRVEGRAALERFDELWGINNLDRTAGQIVFDYELT